MLAVRGRAFATWAQTPVRATQKDLAEVLFYDRNGKAGDWRFVQKRIRTAGDYDRKIRSSQDLVQYLQIVGLSE